MGLEAAPQFTEAYGGAVPSQTVRSYVTEMGGQLANVSERPDLPWEFTIVDSSVINAFALPGGKVFLSRGLADKLTNEAFDPMYSSDLSWMVHTTIQYYIILYYTILFYIILYYTVLCFA